MDDRVWVGPEEHAPPGWVRYESVEAFLASADSAVRIVVDDRSAVLREPDFLRLFAHSPLAKIERIVGPWRAGVGRTDPTWPLVTTRGDDLSPLDQPDDRSHLPLSVPLTAQYDEIAAAQAAQLACLEGITISVLIADGELRQMWEDILRKAGAVIVALPDSAAVWLMDDSPRREQATPEEFCVHLTTAPWLVRPSADEVGFSAYESPWSVIQAISERLKRGDREVD